MGKNVITLRPKIRPMVPWSVTSFLFSRNPNEIPYASPVVFVDMNEWIYILVSDTIALHCDRVKKLRFMPWMHVM